MLRTYTAFGQTQVVYNHMARMQGMYLPREIAIFEGPRKVLTATVDTIDGIAATAPELTPRGNLVGVKDTPRGRHQLGSRAGIAAEAWLSRLSESRQGSTLARYRGAAGDYRDRRPGARPERDLGTIAIVDCLGHHNRVAMSVQALREGRPAGRSRDDGERGVPDQQLAKKDDLHCGILLA